MPLSSSTKVISPDIIFFRESLNSLSCSRVSFLVSSYSSASSSSLGRPQEETLIHRICPETSQERRAISGILVSLPSAPVQPLHCWALLGFAGVCWALLGFAGLCSPPSHQLSATTDNKTALIINKISHTWSNI